MVRSFQRRAKQVPWQLTDQTCELLEGIRCADSLAMFLGQDATALTMKNMKSLKVNPPALGTKIEACFYHEAREGNPDTASDTENRSSYCSS